MHLLGYEEEVYVKELQQLMSIIKEKPNLKIIATDISADAIKIAKINATHANVEDLILLEQCDFTKTKLPPEQGVVFLNPEYGERLGEEKNLELLYTQIGDFLKKQCTGYTGYIFTGNLDLAKRIGLKPKRRTEFLNGKIDCRLLEYELYAGTKRVVE
jgi:putative N6-adenine-specific DNA methylase